MAENKEDHAIPLGAISNWIDYFDENREQLTKLFQSNIAQSPESAKYHPCKVDWEINTKVSLFVGDITRLKVDGIVNSSNTTPGVGVYRSEKLQKLYKELKTLKVCETGQAKTIKGYNFPAKYIVHTAGPCGADRFLLTKCYDNCLAEMTKHRMKSLAFPCNSLGGSGYPEAKAARVALHRVRSYLANRKTISTLDDIERIIFCLPDEESLAAYKISMQVFFPCGDEDDYVYWLIEKKERELEPLDGFIQITTTEPDMVTFDDDPKKRRAKMPCGHVIGSESMTMHCREIFDRGGVVFKCPDPSCDAKWQYFLVRHVACLTFRQKQEFERRISQHYVRNEEGTRQCPQCHVMCHRQNKDQLCVQCILCTLKTNEPFDFCWNCLGVWNSYGGNTCGNKGCSEDDDRISMLATCPIKRILDRFDAPSIRGCPNCGLLIEYLCACTHMQCTGCSYCFCFLCLKGGAATKNELTCRAFDSTCTIAPRQTSLPGT